MIFGSKEKKKEGLTRITQIKRLYSGYIILLNINKFHEEKVENIKI